MKGNFDHLNEEFKYYKGKSLFAIVEMHFPFEKHVAHFLENYEKSVKGKYIEAELERLKKEYGLIENNNLLHSGYSSKTTGHDWKTFHLLLDFESWKNHQGTQLTEMYAFHKRFTPMPFEQFMELNFLQLLAQGVNDALFEEYLIQLKTNLSTKSEEHKRKTTIQYQTIKLFCELMNSSGAETRKDESAKSYCHRVCAMFELPYSETLKQRFRTYNGMEFKRHKHLPKVIKQILPKLPQEMRAKIDAYISGNK